MSSDAKKGGIFGSIVEAAKHELFVEDAPAGRAADPAPPVAVSSPSSGGVVSSLGAMPPEGATVDPAALKVVKENVYTNVGGHPSRFVKFMKMLEALGKPQDALRALQVADESITAAGILQDISAHLDLLDACTKTAAAQFDAASQDRLGRRDKEIASLQAANQNAAKEIERHQKETSERNGQIATLQQARAEDEGKITAAKQREAGAEAAVRDELQSMQRLFSSNG